MFWIARLCVRENQDVVRKKCVQMNNNMPALSNSEKKDLPKFYHEMLNVESDWENEIFPNVNPVNLV